MNGETARTLAQGTNSPVLCGLSLLTLSQGAERSDQLNAFRVGNVGRRPRSCSYRHLAGGILRKHNLHQSQHKPNLLLRPGSTHYLAWTDVAFARHISGVVRYPVTFIAQY